MGTINDENNIPAEDSTGTPVILYQADGHNVPVQVRYKDETFWLTQKAMAELFDVTVPNISYTYKAFTNQANWSENELLKIL